MLTEVNVMFYLSEVAQLYSFQFPEICRHECYKISLKTKSERNATPIIFHSIRHTKQASESWHQCTPVLGPCKESLYHLGCSSRHKNKNKTSTNYTRKIHASLYVTQSKSICASIRFQ